MRAMATRILLVDDHVILRQGLCALFERETDMVVVAEAGDGYAAIDLAQKLKPEIAIIDIGMPKMNGIETTRHLRDSLPALHIVGLSQHADRRFVAAMFQAGASAYLLKTDAFAELVFAVREVLAGHTYISPQLVGTIVEDYVQLLSGSPSCAATLLSPREREILQLLVEGHSAENIAKQLFISVNTVGTHRRHIMDKLDIHTLPELTKYAIREGLTFLDI